MKCRGCQQDNPSHANFCLKCGAPLKGIDPTAKRYTDLKDEVAGLRRSLTEALEQQTATAEILRVISSSPTDIQPVFDAIVRSAVRLCNAYFGVATRYDGELARLVAHHNMTPGAVAALHRVFTHPPTTETATGRVLLSGTIDHTVDFATDVASPAGAQIAIAGGFRTNLVVPMLRGERVIGSISVARREAQSFSEAEIALLKTFADQAVIAFENVRLFKELEARNAELKESLDQQMATADILGVISSSPTNMAPVFSTILASATRLCEASFAVLFLYDGEALRVAAHQNASPQLIHHYESGTRVTPSMHGPARRAALLRETVHIADMTAEPGLVPIVLTEEDVRTVLAVPLLREGALAGVIAMWRRNVRPFTDKQVALVRTFADQAVIAIENVRLFTELQEKNRALTDAHEQVSEALERQTTTGEILRIISQAHLDVQPVFEAIADSAMRLLGASATAVGRYDGGLFSMVSARGGLPGSGDAAKERLQSPHPPTSPPELPVLTKAVHHVIDVDMDPSCSLEFRRHAAARGFRSFAAVPMLRGDEPLGTIAVSRAEAGGFSATEIALLQTFADQAVIAIENVRLFNELEARNRDLTATSEILQVISRSPTDVEPVFDALAENAVRLCEAERALIYRLNGQVLGLVAAHNVSGKLRTFIEGRPMRPGRESGAARAAIERRTIHIHDALSDPEHTYPVHHVELPIRTVLAIPMLRAADVLGVIVIYRHEVLPFTDDQVALMETFADQAVIAIENVRLFTELQEKNQALTQAHAQVSEALERQTATSEILRVMASSPTDTQPVFDTIAENAARLCAARDAQVLQVDGDVLRLVSAYGLPSMPSVRSISRGHAVGRAVIDRQTIHVRDMAQAIAEFPETTAPQHGVQSVLAVPLVRHHVAIGVIRVSRTEIRPFTEAQISLLQTFADQAVIAIENVRLFTELEASNRELRTALDTQTATSDILNAISRSQTDVQPVFDAIVASAVRLLAADNGALTRIVGDNFELAAFTGTGGAGDAALRAAFPWPLQAEGAHTKAVRDRTSINIADARTDLGVSETRRALARVFGYGSLAVVPLLRHGEALGTIAVTRREPGGFTDDQIALLQTFADQAVIAIENVRLFKELQARTGELTRSVSELRALAEISQALSSTLDVDVVLNTIITRANDLIGADGCTIFEYDEVTEQFHLRATRNLEPRLVELARGTPLRKGDQGILGQLPMGRQAVQVPDIRAGSYSSPISDALIDAGYRAVVAVPLIREDHLIGALTMNRKTPGDFPAETIELLQTFATQSALAIQNARLFREIEEKSRQLEAASQHKSEFLANMSHELRTPLNAIIGFSEVLSERMFGELNEKQDEYLKDIHASGQHLLSLINDILDLSKVEAGRMELEVTDFDLPVTIDNALVLVRERAARRSIALHATVDQCVGQVQADERKIRQVLLNLLSNAIKFTPEGGRIDVEAKPVNGSTEVSVTDTGVGIAPEDQEAVFEEFRQVGTVDKKVEGTGLGLALSRKFIELHGGRIWVKSQVGQGSTFTFTIPMHRAE